MKATILLDYNEDTRKVEDEEKSRFLRGILESCFENTDVADQVKSIYSTDGTLSVPQKMKLRELLAAYRIQVIDDLDGHLQIYLENELIGEWFKPQYKLRRDLRQLDPRKQIYLEMAVNCESVFDEIESEGEV